MSSLHSKTLFASFAVMAIVAATFVGISVLDDDSEATNFSPFKVSVGDTWSSKQVLPGSTITGSVPGITFTSQIMGGQMFILGSGTFTTAGTYDLSSDAGHSVQVIVSASGGSSSGGGSGSGGSGSGGSGSSGGSPTPNTASYSVTVGDVWSSKQFAPGTAIESGSLPGISFVHQILGGESFLMASGTFTTAGTYVLVTDRSWTVTVTVKKNSGEDPISFTSPAAVDSVSGSSVTYQATTNISGTTFTVTGTGNASWLTISSSGLLSGTAPNVNIKTTYTYSIKATSPGGQSTVQKVTFEVYPVAKLSVTSSNIYETVGEPITPIVVNSNIACSLSLQNSNALTDLGLTWTASTGTISGTPTKTGSAVIKVLGSTTVGPSQFPSIEISITIREATLNITSEPPTGIFAVGKNYTYELTANQAVTWSISGNPSWLALTGSKVTGQVTGITEEGTVSYTVTAVTVGGQSVNQKVTINVEPTIAFTSVPTASCSVTPVYNYQPDGSWIIAGLFGRSIVSSDAAAPSVDALGSPVAAEGGSGGDSSTAPAPNITESGTRTFKFVWTGENAERVIWDFGDGKTGEGFQIVHTYAKNGTYTYVCTGINSIGQSSVSGTITVNVADDGLSEFVLIGIGILLLIVLILVIRRATKRRNAGSSGRRR